MGRAGRVPTGVAARARQQAEPLQPQRFTTLCRMLGDPTHKVVLSCGGGALPGLCGNLALTRILEELGLAEHIAEVWGTSAGAIVGGGWASGSSTDAMLDLVGSLARPGAVDLKLGRFARQIFAAARPFRRRPLPDGIIDGDIFVETIEAGLTARTFEDCRIPFRAIACTDDGNARTKVFRSGRLLPAIYQSMALPGIVKPRPADDGETYYDGGLVEKTPLRSVIAEHGRSGDDRKLLILATHFVNEKVQQRASGFLKRFLATLYALEELAWDYQLREARDDDRVTVLLLDPHIPEPSLFGFENTAENYLHSRQAFADGLQNSRLITTLGTA